MKKTIMILVALLALVFGSLCVAKHSSKSQLSHCLVNQSCHNQISLLFIQQAKTASVMPSKKYSACYRIVLSQPHKNIIYFSDQPVRRTGHLSIHHYLTSWEHAKVRPNVAMQGFLMRPSGVKEVSNVAELSHPVYNKQKNQMTYIACPISKQRPIKAVKQLHDITIFIDNFAPFPP